MRLLIDKDAVEQFYDRMDIVKDFLFYCKSSLEIHHPYDVYFVYNREQYKIKTAAVCRHETKKIFIYVKGRAFSDVLKSLAHEMVHVKQHERHLKVKHEFLHFHSKNEDEANMMGVSLFNAYAEVKGNDLIFDN